MGIPENGSNNNQKKRGPFEDFLDELKKQAGEAQKYVKKEASLKDFRTELGDQLSRLHVNETVKESLEKTRERIREVTRETQEVVKKGVSATGGLVEQSRGSRLKTEDQNGANSDQGKLVKGCLVFVGNTAMQMIPVPVGIPFWPTLTVGDLVTGYGALVGKDLITQRKLDLVDRGLYAIATLIPILPGTVLVEPLKLARRNIEEAVHAHNEGDHKTRNKHIGDLVQNGWKFADHLNKKKKENKD